ncbi:PAS domain-containing protein [Tsuneonella sp. YG55]|uniref:PAS domain-containing protein n=1 Tax=Tsuneonella litorea TaxID=2976475 RepID=A0A9X2W126_9SPHN|nr:PAS domain-containing protein [Tsuneonella litorea]MCT2559175.1 PAS domain-containing protein [Tsuneonella litorea]
MCAYSRSMTAFDESAALPQDIIDMFARSGVALTIADCTRPDSPLVGVNQAFLDLSGYPAEAVIGRNCRFLQPQEGPGPVRRRMRQFLRSPEQYDEKFVVPNVTRDGQPFLNLVYMAKLARGGETTHVLGSQFAIDAPGRLDPALYDRALSEDLRQIDVRARDAGWTLLGSFNVLASSHSIIARARMD